MANKLLYTLSLHTPLQGDPHYDLFIDIGTELLTHLTAPASPKKTITFQQGRPHRRIYLTFQGDLSQNRGKVAILSRGHIALHKNSLLKKPLVKVRMPLRLAKPNAPAKST